MQDFLAAITGSPARAKVLRAFALNEGRTLSLEDAIKRTGLSAKQVSAEAEQLASWGVLKKMRAPGQAKRMPAKTARTKKVAKTKSDPAQSWILNLEFKYARALSSFIHEVSPVRHEQVLNALKRSGRLAAVILSGSFVGDPTRPADLVIAADAVNERRLEQIVRALEPELGREIRYAVFSTPEFRYRMTIQDRLIRDTLDFPHQILFDRTRML